MNQIDKLCFEYLSGRILSPDDVISFLEIGLTGGYHIRINEENRVYHYSSEQWKQTRKFLKRDRLLIEILK